MATPRCSLVVGYRGGWRHPELQKQPLVQGYSCSILSPVGKPKPVPGHKWREDLGEQRGNSKRIESIRHHSQCSEAVWVTPQESHTQQTHGQAAWEGHDATRDSSDKRPWGIPNQGPATYQADLPPQPLSPLHAACNHFSLSERLSRVSIESTCIPWPGIKGPNAGILHNRSLPNAACKDVKHPLLSNFHQSTVQVE